MKSREFALAQCFVWSVLAAHVQQMTGPGLWYGMQEKRCNRYQTPELRINGNGLSSIWTESKDSHKI